MHHYEFSVRREFSPKAVLFAKGSPEQLAISPFYNGSQMYQHQKTSTPQTHNDKSKPCQFICAKLQTWLSSSRSNAEISMAIFAWIRTSGFTPSLLYIAVYACEVLTIFLFSKETPKLPPKNQQQQNPLELLTETPTCFKLVISKFFTH